MARVPHRRAADPRSGARRLRVHCRGDRRAAVRRLRARHAGIPGSRDDARAAGRAFGRRARLDADGSRDCGNAPLCSGAAAAGFPCAARAEPDGVSPRRRSRAGGARCGGGAAAHGASRAGGRLTMYVAVKGGERAIDNAHRLLAAARRGDPATPELSLAQISEQLALGVDRVMAEGTLYDRELAALAIKQARGDLIEAIFLIRAYRTTLPRFGASQPIDTGAMEIRRRISAAFKDLPGGQILGPTFDYTHRLLDTGLAEGAVQSESAALPSTLPPVGGEGGEQSEPGGGNHASSEQE